MASKPLVSLVFATKITTSWQTIYTAPNGVDSVGIDASTFNNYTSTQTKISVRLIRSSTGDENQIISNQSIRGNDNFLSPGLIGQALVTGDQIQAMASNNDRITCFITGTEVSS